MFEPKSHFALPLTLAIGLVACDSPSTAQEAQPAPDYERDASGFEQELAELDHAIAGAEARANELKNSWMSLESVAAGYMQRARLTGDYGDYAAAEAALTEAFERAVPGSGPKLRRAALNFSLHRLDAMTADLDDVAERPLLDDPTRSYLEGLRGDQALLRGDYTEALAKFEQARALRDDLGSRVRVALYRWRTGNFAEAEALYLSAFDLHHGVAREPVAWLHLQLGIMDLERGRYDEAFDHYADAAQELGGYYLVEEHIAEIFVLEGYWTEAEAIYRDVIERTGNPEFMDALAGLLLERGKRGEALEWIDRADAAYAEQIALFPEAAYGHALEHYVDFGTPAEALELAEANYAVRPNADAAMWLARTRLSAGDVDGARDAIGQTLESPIRTADGFYVAYEVYAAAGEHERAKEFLAQALDINPRVAD